MTNPINCPHTTVLQNLDTKEYYCQDCGIVMPAPGQTPPVEPPVNGA